MNIKGQIKKELIDFYDSLSNKIDIRAQRLLLSFENKSQKENDIKRINELNSKLIKRIEKVLDSSLDQVNYYFENLQTNIDPSITTIPYLRENVLKSHFNYLEFQDVDEVHKSIKANELGILIESDWFLEQNQLYFIRHVCF
jgi:hypothetical protein